MRKGDVSSLVCPSWKKALERKKEPLMVSLEPWLKNLAKDNK